MTYKTYCPDAQRAIVHYTFPGKRQRTYEAETAPIQIQVSQDFGENVVVFDTASLLLVIGAGGIAFASVAVAAGVREVQNKEYPDAKDIEVLDCDGTWKEGFKFASIDQLGSRIRQFEPYYPNCKPVPPWNIRIKDNEGTLLFSDTGTGEPTFNVECECPKIDYRLKVEAYPGHECLPVKEFSRRLEKARQDYENK